MSTQSRISFDLHTDGKNLVDPCAVLHSALGKVGLSSRTWRNWRWLRPALENTCHVEGLVLPIQTHQLFDIRLMCQAATTNVMFSRLSTN